MRNTFGNHLEIYLRFERDEASRVVKAILGTFEEYMGCDGAEAPCASKKEGSIEEIYTHLIQRFNETQLKATKEASETGLRKFGAPDIHRPRFGM
jgi:L-cysteine desulfidase